MGEANVNKSLTDRRLCSRFVICYNNYDSKRYLLTGTEQVRINETDKTVGTAMEEVDFIFVERLDNDVRNPSACLGHL